MCRLLAIASGSPLDAHELVTAFAERCRDSKEFQGHGWGVAWREGGRWRRHRSVAPIWEDSRPRPPASRMWLVHARSAFRNEGITVENNMPFLADDLAFGFNGELRGVRLSAPGDTGAARLLHLLERFRAVAKGDVLQALERLDRVVSRRSSYVRAMNIMAADGERLYLHSHFSEDPDYFRLHTATLTGADGVSCVVACSEELRVPGLSPWTAVDNHSTLALEPVPC